MIQVFTLPLPPLGANCYLAWEEASDTCVVIDPGGAPQRILAKAAALGKTIDAVILTHGHFDHVGGAEAIVKATGCALWMNEGDYSETPSQLYPLASSDFREIGLWEEGEEISAGGLTLSVMETPGHSWGSVCLFCQNVIFTGDTLFQGSCGRTDLPGGDWARMLHSLSLLSRLPGDYTVYPGHGNATTLSAEKRKNPYLRGSL